MKKTVMVVFVFAAACLAVATLRGLPAAATLAGAEGPSLPRSLDAFYPPRAPQPLYLFRMMSLGNAFTGVISDLLQGDEKNAATDLAAFKTLYAEISKLVPEWENMFPLQPLAEAETAFQAAVRAKDPGPFMAAVEKVENVCSSCHRPYMAAVQMKYHWKDFRTIMAKDSQRGLQVGFPQLMQALNLGFSGSWIDAGQGQPDHARKRFREFDAAFQSLKETCQECHGTSERKYYVDTEAQALVDAYGKALDAGAGNAMKTEAAMAAVGNEICFKCHLVHIPAAYARRR